MKAGDLAEVLARDAERVAMDLFPNGKRVGQEWEVGSLSGEAGKSLNVHLTGSKAGVWKDFATGDSGDLLDLWGLVYGIDVKAAMEEIKNVYGLHDSSVVLKSAAPAEEKPAPPEWPEHQRSDQVYDWLQGERGLTPETIKAFNVYSTSPAEALFPSVRDGELVMGKIRNIHDKKKMRVIKNSDTKTLFGWQAISNERAVIICEGEIDAMSWHQMGYPALSVPNGAQGMTWIEAEYDRLAQFDEIYVAFDMDEPGQEGANEVIARLGSNRCLLVDTGDYEDANLMLISCEPADAKRLAMEAVRGAQRFDPVELVQAADLEREMIDRHLGKDPGQEGFDPAYSDIRGKVLHRWHELTLITGINGHGKSQMVMQETLAGIAQGHRACVFSGEMPIKNLLGRLNRQASGKRDMTIPLIKETHAWYRDKLWLFSLTGTAKAERLLEVFEYAHQRYGIRIFVIDSLLKVGLDLDDYNGQKEFVDKLCDFKNQYPVHIFLIAHPRKGENEYQMPGKLDIKGTGAIADLADTLVVMWRNKIKEAKLEEYSNDPSSLDPDEAEKYRKSADAKLNFNKQRNGEWEGSSRLFWASGPMQYRSADLVAPIEYIKGGR